MEVRPYVSEIDPTRSVTLQGISVPGLRSRFLETGVELQAGQTLALGGLLQMRTESINTGLPFFGDLPYLGTFFRRSRTSERSGVADYGDAELCRSDGSVRSTGRWTWPEHGQPFG